MGRSIFLILVSSLSGLVLLTRVYSILGQHFLVVSGTNLMDSQGIPLTPDQYLLWWAGTIAVFLLGIWGILDKLGTDREIALVENGGFEDVNPRVRSSMPSRILRNVLMFVLIALVMCIILFASRAFAQA